MEDNNKSETEDDVVSEVEEDDKWKYSDFEPDTAELSSDDSEHDDNEHDINTEENTT